MTVTAEEDARWQAWRRRGPVGHWRSAAGSFGQVAGDEVWFGPDGEGWVHSRSPMFGDQLIRFRWKPYDEAQIEILVPEWPAALRDADAAPDDELPEWQRVRWERCHLRTDAGPVTAMRECGTEGFWLLPDPLVWQGPAAPVPR